MTWLDKFLNDLRSRVTLSHEEEPSELTLNDFRGSRVYVKDIGDAVGDESWCGEEGFIYMNHYFIAMTNKGAPGNPWTIIGNFDHEAESLLTIEMMLHDFVISQGSATVRSLIEERERDEQA